MTEVDSASEARHAIASSRPALFAAGAWRGVELDAGDVPLLQSFFERNSDYFVAVNGQPAQPGEADEEVHGPLPAGWPYTRKWIVGFVDASGMLLAMANVVSDLLAVGVWHVGLFIVATRLHGTGAAQSMYQALEGWTRASGATWLRLGVVAGNARAERFWAGRSFVEVRSRPGIEMGLRVQTVRVLAKSLAGGTLDEYLALLPRDRADG